MKKLPAIGNLINNFVQYFPELFPYCTGLQIIVQILENACGKFNNK